jgi:predicted membrane-bound mannosyltransferase
MHADEAILADKLGTFLASGTYPYDPHDYHGPVLAYLGWTSSHLAARTNYQALTETTIRLAPAIAGILLALSPLLFAPVIGWGSAVAAAAICAASPVLVYYSRYYIPEIPLALATALFLVSVVRGWWISAGLAAALMMATKETAVLALTAAALAYIAAYRSWRVPAVFFVALLVGIWVFFLPPWKWGLLVRFVPAYLARAGSAMHAHPLYRYLQWLSVTEALVLAFAVAGIVANWRRREPQLRFLTLYALILLAIYSAIPYKTPWCAVSPIYALVVAGATGRWRVATAGAVICLATIAWLAATRYATDQRNPWAYAHTGPGVYTIRDRISGFPRSTPIDVFSTENLWPLPWYLRQFPNQHWWREVPFAGPAAPIVLVSPALEPALVRKLYEGPPPGERELYMNLFDQSVDLRQGVEVRGYVAKSLWDQRATASGN